jgi:hypothetical protein
MGQGSRLIFYGDKGMGRGADRSGRTGFGTSLQGSTLQTFNLLILLIEKIINFKNYN